MVAGAGGMVEGMTGVGGMVEGMTGVGGMVERGIAGGGMVDEGMAGEGIVDDGMVDDGIVDDGMVDVRAGAMPAGTGVTVSRMTPPPMTLPSMVVWPLPRTRSWQARRSLSGWRSQRASAFCINWSGEGSVSAPLRAACCAAPASRKQAALSCWLWPHTARSLW